MVAVALGIGTALCWGLADFLGGVRTRRLTLATVLLVSQLTGLAAIAVVVVVGRAEVPALGEIAPALAAGERPGAVPIVGMAAAFAGVLLATRSPHRGDGGASPRQALGLATIAALGFGGFYVGIDAAVDDANPFWALLAARASAGAVLVVALLIVRPGLGGGRADLPSLALIGLLDVTANVCFTLGTDTGLLSVVSVLASLYPVATVVLARALLGERLAAVQGAGVGVALAGVAMISAG